VDDAYLQYFVRFVIAWEEMHRGRLLKADALAEEGLTIGQQTKDPRSTGFGLSLKSWIALISEDYKAALVLAESALQVSCTPADRITSEHGIIALHLLLNRPGATETCHEYLEKCVKNGWHWRTMTLDGLMGLSKVVRGEIRTGLKMIEQVIAQREREGYRTLADWHGVALAEIYLRIISGDERLPIWPVINNIGILSIVILTARKRVTQLMGTSKQILILNPVAITSDTAN
jgi:hypothetical protein